MSRRRDAGPEQQYLFDLPLAPEVAEPPSAAPSPSADDEADELERPADLREHRTPASEVRDPAPDELLEASSPDDDRPPAVSPGTRWLAGAADVVAHVSMLVLGWAGARALGAPSPLAATPAFALFLLVFSFLYTVIGLVFWGQSPGMVVFDLRARSLDGQALTLGQAMRRWLTGVLVALLAGLPLFVGRPGRSLSDWTSGSRTLPV